MVFYRRRPDMMAVRVNTTPTFRSGTRNKLFPGTLSRYRPPYDVDREGQHFLMLKLADVPPSEHHFVVNWFEELRRRAPADRAAR